jgi:ABC-2 type transport system permease protein
MKALETVWLFFRFLSQNTKIKLEYKLDSFILFVSGASLQALGFLFIAVLFTKVPNIAGWNQWEIIFMLAAIYISEGLVSFAFEGAWQMAFLVNSGEMDRMLLRPVSPVLQILTFTMGIHGIGNMALGAVLLSLSLSHVHVAWTFARVLFIPLFIVSACAIRTAISFAANCSAFWLKSYYNAFPLMVYQVADFAKYPPSIFGKVIESLILVVVPYGFISYVPACWLFEKAWWGVFAWGAPLVALWCCLAARWVFYRGLRRYDGSGN